MVTFLISLKTPPTTNIPNLQESLEWLIEEANHAGLWDVDGLRFVLPTISDVVITPFQLMETT